MSQSYRSVKRAIDIVVAGLGLVATAPVQIVIASLVRKHLGSPVLFRQTRPGTDGQPFTMVKFKTMLDMDRNRGLIQDEDRMTDFGRTLRSTSLDELPTLWNVFRGDMSLVGPRPLLVEYMHLYTRQQARRHDVRPGITGLAQVNGRNATSWKERLDYDVQYVERISFLLDVYIIARTFGSVIRSEGISAEGHATMPRFGGESEPA